jgi:hypothetical protein
MREGVWRANWLQREPRESSDIRNHPELFNQLKDVLEDVLQFVHDNVGTIEFLSYTLSNIIMQIKYHEPETYNALEVYVDILPDYERSPAHPYSNLVINVRACTKGHRDHCDRTCTTFTVSDCEGGEICLHESGLVFDTSGYPI